LRLASFEAGFDAGGKLIAWHHRVVAESVAEYAVNLSLVSGFPAIVVPVGFTREVYDRVPDASDPNGSRLDGPKPHQLSRCDGISCTTLYRPPKGFGPVAGEP
jgi:hypothetical protein